MIELLWIGIAALGLGIAVVVAWNVFYVGPKLRTYRDALDSPKVEWMRVTTAAMQQIYDDIKAEIAKREALEEMIGKYIAEPHPIMITPQMFEYLYQGVCARAAQEHDPDCIIRQAEGKDWEGGCGHN